jgi:polyferredoxin
MVLLVLAIGADFAAWYQGLTSGHYTGTRPPGVEGFLPIAALMSLRHLWLTGEVHPVHPAGLVILLAELSFRAFGRRLALPRLLDVPLRGLKYALLLGFAYVIFVAMRPENLAAFLDSPYNRVADIKMLLFFQQLSPFARKSLGALGLLSLVIPYFWCRYLCPYGALLGLLSLLSPLKITRHAASCIDCDLCTRACPSNLPVATLARVRSDECFGCLSCVAACPVPRALRVETPAPWRLSVRPAAFALLLLVLFGGTIEAARIWGVWRNQISDREYAIRVREIDHPRYAH